jgi:hypothetical protein
VLPELASGGPVLAEPGDEMHWIYWFGSRSLLAVHELSYRYLQVLIECRAVTKENQRKRLCPLFVCVAHDGYFQCPVEAFHEPIIHGEVDGRLRQLNATHPVQGLEKLGFKETSLVGGDGLGTTEGGYPAGQ